MLYFHKFIVTLTGSLFIAAGTHCFLVPNKILDGGVLGIALIVNYLSGAKIGLVMILCSVPLFTLAWYYERSFFYSSLHGLLISSLIMDLATPLQHRIVNYLDITPVGSSILGGFVVGTGIGLMLKYETSTGGTDLLAQFIAKGLMINVGVIIFLLDGVVISLGGILVSAETFFLSMLTIAAGGLATSLCTMKNSDRK
ncbi:YitT family protein [Paenibacillus sp. J2TS4]|uniref:YitT family protein n=1 Tax=Paenibacillus sp. J2TS4 TaxID=2807194 RepID=UPI001B0FAA54|nr:hypothetical protein J2TS4_10140 [Paenibacillus sp. J2TS4]